MKPHFDTAVRAVIPAVTRTQKEWNGRVVPQWNQRVVPQWKKRVVPQWNKHVVPQWNKYATPRIAFVEQKVEPYRALVSQEYTKYSGRVGPRYKATQSSLKRWQRQAQPYIVLAATKTHEGYQTAKPYAIPIWNQIKAALKQFLIFAREQRRLFVDPHVARIWEKMIELSSGKPKGSGTKKEPPAPSAAAPVTKLETNTETVANDPPAASATSEDAGTMESTATESVISATENTVGSTSSVLPDVTSPAPSPSGSSIESAASVIAESVGSADISSNSAHITGPSQIVIDPIPTPTVIPAVEEAVDAEIDLDEFARDLGLDESTDPTLSIGLTPAETLIPEETEEEKAERIRQRNVETAKKRASIEKRHSKWETDLHELIKSQKKSLRKALVAIRKPAAAELKSSETIRAAVDGLTAEGEKYLKGAEAYLKTLKKEQKGTVKVGLWDKVVEKVDGKFQDRLKETESVVNGWYIVVLDQEAQEVSTLPLIQPYALTLLLTGSKRRGCGQELGW